MLVFGHGCAPKDFFVLNMLLHIILSPWVAKCRFFNDIVKNAKDSKWRCPKFLFFVALERFAPILKFFFQKKLNFKKCRYFDIGARQNIFFPKTCYFTYFYPSVLRGSFLPSEMTKMPSIFDLGDHFFQFRRKIFNNGFWVWFTTQFWRTNFDLIYLWDYLRARHNIYGRQKHIFKLQKNVKKLARATIPARRTHFPWKILIFQLWANLGKNEICAQEVARAPKFSHFSMTLDGKSIHPKFLVLNPNSHKVIRMWNLIFSNVMTF